MKIYHYILLSFLLFTGYSCATIFSGTYQKVKLTSNPPGAEIYVNNKPTSLATPSEIKLPRKVYKSKYNTRNQYIYTFKKDGYEDAVVIDNANINPTVWLNFLFIYTVPFGIPIDFISGAARKYNREVNAYLTKIDNYNKTEEAISGRFNYVFKKMSDVDDNIPITPSLNKNKYALIIGNEDYTSYQTDLSAEANVQFARNDATAFKEYAIKTMGIPKENIIFLLDGTYGQMNQAINKANKILELTQGESEFVVYYAGHGLPDEVTKEPYLIPVDINGNNVNQAISLNYLYRKLTEYPSKRVTVFIDACFSGGARNYGLIATRGVKINPKISYLSGNIIVFSASSDVQSSLPYAQQKHGLFTYFLLKKIKDSSGQITYKDLSDYLKDKVALNSVLINNKEQTPTISVGRECSDKWQKWRISD